MTIELLLSLEKGLDVIAYLSHVHSNSTLLPLTIFEDSLEKAFGRDVEVHKIDLGCRMICVE